MHQVLYNKWRPAVFSDIVGQPHITKTLLNQLRNGTLAYAYLFTGSRGTGKTTCAKLLARAVNCENPQDGEPCNLCPSCLGILNGSITDVAEIDAASHSGVDNIRSLRDELVYSPVSARRRVYIIDEVHMLSTGAFNALLKTIEEPPPHVLFILATTETHKVPATIVSRCQRFAFRRISQEDMADRLRLICQREGFASDPAALDLIAHLGDGALRDAISLLDQCLSIASGSPLTEQLVRDTLGLTGLDELAHWLLELDDLKASMLRIEEVYHSGLDFNVVLGQLSSMLRDILMGRMLGDLSASRLPAKTAQALADKWPNERILWALSHFQEAQGRLSRCFDKRLEAELCLIRLASPEAAPASNSVPSMPAQSMVERKSGKATGKDIPPAKPQAAPAAVPEVPAIEKPPADTSVSPASNQYVSASNDPRWKQLLDTLNPMLRNMLQGTDARTDGDRLLIQTDDHFMQGILNGSLKDADIKQFFPGGLTLTVKNDDTPKNSLDKLAELAGDLLIEE